MNKRKLGFSGIILGLVVGGAFVFSCLKTIKPGYVGIVYSMNGGVKNKTLSQGLNFVSPFAKVKEYTIANEQAYLSKDKKEGSKDDDSFFIPTADGKTVNVDLEFSYRFDAERLPQTYTKFKGQSGKEIEETFIRGKIKAWTGEVSSKFSVIDIYGEKRSELNAAVLKHVKEKFDEYGIIIDSVNFSRIELDSATSKAIQARINKQQELEAYKIETEKAREKAKKQLVEAEAEAKAKLIEAEGQAKANKKLSDSITPELIKMKEADARMKHGWIEIQGSSTAVIKDK